MNKVFEKIIEKLEEEKVKGIYDSSSIIGEKNVWGKAIEIVKQEAEQYNSGWIPVSEKLPEIDEAIAKYKEITNIDSNCPAHCNISCDKCVQESRQLAKWLEELKRRREYDGEEERDNRERCIK